jgi:hypothetical protein
MTAPTPPVDPTPDPVEDPPAQGDPNPPVTPAPAKPETDWRAEAKKWEVRAKENKTAADKLTAFEESQKTEFQKIQDRAEAAEKRAADLEAAEQKRQADAVVAAQVAAWKTKIADDTGIPASALRGTTQEEIRAHAKEIQALLPDPNARRGGVYVPAEGRSTAGGSDPAAQFAALLQKARGV